MFIKNVFIVSCTEHNFNKIQKIKKKSDIINPYLIRNKLIEKGKMPSEEIVSYHIIKKINTFKQCKTSQFIYYYSSNVSELFLREIKRIFDISEYEISYHLLIDNSVDREHLENIIEEFDSVQYIENL